MGDARGARPGCSDARPSRGAHTLVPVNTPIIKHGAPLAGLLTITALLAAASGCYERTVGARGLGTTGRLVQEPYRSETVFDHAFDRVIDGPPPSGYDALQPDPPSGRQPATLSTGEKRDPGQ